MKTILTDFLLLAIAIALVVVGPMSTLASTDSVARRPPKPQQLVFVHNTNARDVDRRVLRWESTRQRMEVCWRKHMMTTPLTQRVFLIVKSSGEVKRVLLGSEVDAPPPDQRLRQCVKTSLARVWFYKQPEQRYLSFDLRFVPSRPLTKAAVCQVMQGSFKQVRSCYESHLSMHPTAEGRVVVQLVVLVSGAVAGAQIQTSDFTPYTATKLHKCVTDAVRKLHFPKRQHGATVIVTYPFNFKIAP